MRFCVTGRCAGRCAACMYFYKCFGAVAKLDFEKGVNGLCVLNSADHFLAGFIYTSASLTQRRAQVLMKLSFISSFTEIILIKGAGFPYNDSHGNNTVPNQADAHWEVSITGRSCLIHISCFVLCNWEERSRHAKGLKLSGTPCLWAHTLWPLLIPSLETQNPLLSFARNRALHS